MLQELLEEQLIELDEEWLHDELDEHDNDEEDETELEQLKKTCYKAVNQIKNFTPTLKNMNKMRRKSSCRKSWKNHWMRLKKIWMMMMSRNLKKRNQKQI